LENWDVKPLSLPFFLSELAIMPPKKIQPSDPAAGSDADTKLNSILTQLASMNNNMEAINRRLDKVDLLGEQLNNIEESMRNISTEHANFKSTLASNQVTISNIQASQVSMDQYNRSWSVRIMELQLSADDESNPFRLVETVYNKVFLPILSGALSEDLIPRIGSASRTSPCSSRHQSRSHQADYLPIPQPRLQGRLLPPQEEVCHHVRRLRSR
jgi:septal ring factor EnvC (AmiA/AmiB activator)